MATSTTPLKSKKTTTVNSVQSRKTRGGQEQLNESALPKKAIKLVEVAETITPRILRLKDAPRYLGMDSNRFNKEIRPGLTEIPIGRQGVGFDRLDLDAWVDAYKQCNGAPGSMRGKSKCEKHPDLNLMASNGLSTSASRTLDAFTKELALAKKRVKKR